jgi:hypothetical protein
MAAEASVNRMRRPAATLTCVECRHGLGQHHSYLEQLPADCLETGIAIGAERVGLNVVFALLSESRGASSNC